MRWYRDRGSGGLRSPDVADVCGMEAEDVYPMRCGSIAVKRNTRTAMPSDRLGHCATLALGPHRCPCLPPWWLVVDDHGGGLSSSEHCPPRRDSLSHNMFFCVLQTNSKSDKQFLITRATSSRISRMPCNKCSYDLRHTALCSCRISQPQLSTLNALAIMLIYRGTSSERGESM